MSEKRLVSIDDAVKLTGKSQSTIYNYIKYGKLETEEVGGKKMINLDSFEKNLETKFTPENEIINKLLEQLETVNTKAFEYAQLAGQVKLLEDSEHRSKEDYFRVKYENEILKEKIKKLESKKRWQFWR